MKKIAVALLASGLLLPGVSKAQEPQGLFGSVRLNADQYPAAWQKRIFCPASTSETFKVAWTLAGQRYLRDYTDHGARALAFHAGDFKVHLVVKEEGPIKLCEIIFYFELQDGAPPADSADLLAKALSQQMAAWLKNGKQRKVLEREAREIEKSAYAKAKRQQEIWKHWNKALEPAYPGSLSPDFQAIARRAAAALNGTLYSDRDWERDPINFFFLGEGAKTRQQTMLYADAAGLLLRLEELAETEGERQVVWAFHYWAAAVKVVVGRGPGVPFSSFPANVEKAAQRRKILALTFKQNL